MSVPPQGGWQPPQQPGPPPNYGQQPPPGWQQGWTQQPGPPPHKGNSIKWLLIAVVVLLVIGISVGATLLFTRGGGGGGTTPSTSAAPSDVASANDTGPVSIITDEPTCPTFIGINNSLADLEAKGWSDRRGALGPQSQWTEEDHSLVQPVVAAIVSAAEQMRTLAQRTPHRVVRELYEQSALYGRLYSDSTNSYTPSDNSYADVFVNGSSAIAGMCNSITSGAASRSILVSPASPPSPPLSPGVAPTPERFITGNDASCTAWVDREKAFVSDTARWAALDASIPSTQWSPEQRATQLSALGVFSRYADDIEKAGRESGNPVFEDFAASAALYIRAYVAASETYTNADSWLYYTAFRLSNTVTGACQAAG
jgi:hypothetical protein